MSRVVVESIVSAHPCAYCWAISLTMRAIPASSANSAHDLSGQMEVYVLADRAAYVVAAAIHVAEYLTIHHSQERALIRSSRNVSSGRQTTDFMVIPSS